LTVTGILDLHTPAEGAPPPRPPRLGLQHQVWSSFADSVGEDELDWLCPQWCGLPPRVQAALDTLSSDERGTPAHAGTVIARVFAAVKLHQLWTDLATDPPDHRSWEYISLQLDRLDTQPFLPQTVPQLPRSLPRTGSDRRVHAAMLQWQDR
jgi:hypothetical protein